MVLSLRRPYHTPPPQAFFKVRAFALLLVVGILLFLFVYSLGVVCLFINIGARVKSFPEFMTAVVGPVLTDYVRIVADFWVPGSVVSDKTLIRGVSYFTDRANWPVLHPVFHGIIFILLGYQAGRANFLFGCLAFPLLLYPFTYRFLQSPFSSPISELPSILSTLVAVQVITVYLGAIIGRWKDR